MGGVTYLTTPREVQVQLSKDMEGDQTTVSISIESTLDCNLLQEKIAKVSLNLQQSRLASSDYDHETL